MLLRPPEARRAGDAEGAGLQKPGRVDQRRGAGRHQAEQGHADGQASFGVRADQENPGHRRQEQGETEVHRLL